jgi:hypothetical protein
MPSIAELGDERTISNFAVFGCGANELANHTAADNRIVCAALRANQPPANHGSRVRVLSG